MRPDIGVPKRIHKEIDMNHEADVAIYFENKKSYKSIQYHKGNKIFLFVVHKEVINTNRSLKKIVEVRDHYLANTPVLVRTQGDHISKLDFSTNKHIRVGKVVVPFNPIKDAWILPGCILERNQTYALAAAKRINHFLGN